METATLRIPTRLPLLRGRRPAAERPEHHLHFDRVARVWLGHEERDPRPAAAALPEVA